MQTSISLLLKKFFTLVLRGVFIGFVALSVFLGGVFAVVSASNSGGTFGEILNKILASNDWTKTDGTVKNAQKLGNRPASEYQHIKEANKTCNPGTCMIGFNSQGEILCQ